MKKPIILIISGVQSCGHNGTPFNRFQYLCREYEVHILSSGGVCDEIRRNAASVRVFSGANLPLLSPLLPFWAVLNVLLLSRRYHVRLVYSPFHSLPALSGFLSTMVPGITWVVDIWDDPELYTMVHGSYPSVSNKFKSAYLKLLFFITKSILKHADLIILALSAGFMKKYGLEQMKVLHVTNGVKLDKMKHDGKDEEKKKILTVVYVGFLRKIRGLDLMLSSASYLESRINDFEFRLVGHLKEREDELWLRKQIESRGLERYVTVTGTLPHEEVINELADADVCLFPFPRRRTLEYIYPIKIFEYMAMGKAIIATRLTGVSEIIKDGYNGILIEPNNPKELADAIYELYGSPELRKRLGENALKDVRQYDWDTVNSAIGEKIDGLLG